MNASQLRVNHLDSCSDQLYHSWRRQQKASQKLHKIFDDTFQMKSFTESRFTASARCETQTAFNHHLHQQLKLTSSFMVLQAFLAQYCESFKSIVSVNLIIWFDKITKVVATQNVRLSVVWSITLINGGNF